MKSIQKLWHEVANSCNQLDFFIPNARKCVTPIDFLSQQLTGRTEFSNKLTFSNHILTVYEEIWSTVKIAKQSISHCQHDCSYSVSRPRQKAYVPCPGLLLLYKIVCTEGLLFVCVCCVVVSLCRCVVCPGTGDRTEKSFLTHQVSS